MAPSSRMENMKVIERAHHPNEVTVTGPSGSALILNGHLWHSGTHNVSDGPRRAVQAVIRAQ